MFWMITLNYYWIAISWCCKARSNRFILIFLVRLRANCSLWRKPLTGRMPILIRDCANLQKNYKNRSKLSYWRNPKKAKTAKFHWNRLLLCRNGYYKISMTHIQIPRWKDKWRNSQTFSLNKLTTGSLMPEKE